MLTSDRCKSFFSRDLPLLGLSVFALASFTNLGNPIPQIQTSKQESALNLDGNLMVYLSAGHKRMLTDLLWVQTLIESDIEHYAKKDLNNWLFIRFLTMATLDPLFYENYLFGGQYLAIVKDDLEGAAIIYDKGLRQYPDDYRLIFNAGYLNYYEMGNFQRGKELLQRIVDHPKAPDYLRSIINKISASSGENLEEVFELVKVNFDESPPGPLREKLASELYAIRAEIDLRCLDGGGTDCRRTDLDGIPYGYRDGKHRSPKKFQRYRINRSGVTAKSVKPPLIDAL